MDGRKALRSRLRTPFFAVQIQTRNMGRPRTPPPILLLCARPGRASHIQHGRTVHNGRSCMPLCARAGRSVHIHRGRGSGPEDGAIYPLTGGLKDAR